MIRALFLAFVAPCAVTGCLAQGPPDKLPMSRDTPFILDVPDMDKRTTTARSQQPEMPAPPQPLPPLSGAPLQAPPPPPGSAGAAQPLQTVNFKDASKSPGPVFVRAWVNGKPIFEDEVFNILGPQLKQILSQTPPAQRDAEVHKAFFKALDSIIDNELLVQDAYRLLEKNNPKALEQVKKKISKDVQKQISTQMRKMNIATMEEYKQVLLAQGTTIETIRRMLERDMMSSGYLYEKIKHQLDKEVCNETVYEYYTQHKNEFMQVDRVKWQDIFIAVGPKHPTMADARQFAEQLLRHWAAGADITKLLEYDDGDSRFRNGDGAGEIRGDIKPRELEPYLFALKPGEFGEPWELTTGVHVYRVLKREYAGLMPFDDKTQTLITNKLKNEMAEQERGHLVRQLRERALIEIDKN